MTTTDHRQTFSAREWKERERTLGDPAENAFEAWCKKRGHKQASYGLRRPDVDLSYVPPFVRYTPDFLTQFGLIEVQGCGRDQTFKFKHEKLGALEEWHWTMYQENGFGVYLWLWNQPLDESVLVDWERLLLLTTDEHGYWPEHGVFDGTKPYVTVTWEQLAPFKGPL